MELQKILAVFAGLVLVSCTALPAIKDQVEYVRPVKTTGDQPIIDTKYDGWGVPFSGSSFGGFLENFDDILDRMNKQIKSLLERFPFSKGSNSSEFPSFPAFPGSFPGAGDHDLSKGNTTSVTKVINGHKVVINETEYKNQDENGGTFFKVRIVDVAPDSSELTTDGNAEEVPTTIKPREDIDNSFENEISKSKEAEPIQTTKRQVSEENFDNIETFDEIDSSMRNSPVQDDFLADENQKTQPGFVDVDNEWNDVEPIETIESNDINQPEKESVQRPIDLSRDTYVNEIMAENGAPTDPEAEVFFVPQLEQDGRMIGVLMDPR